MRLTVLAAGSTITGNRMLAETFSHKPKWVVLNDDGSIRHDGRQPGYLYIVDVPDESLLYPHPHSSMPGLEWLTTQRLQLHLVMTTNPDMDRLLSCAEIAGLEQLYHEMHKEHDG